MHLTYRKMLYAAKKIYAKITGFPKKLNVEVGIFYGGTLDHKFSNFCAKFRSKRMHFSINDRR
jgi:hypothetical protein